jgi:hypothetical protein
VRCIHDEMVWEDFLCFHSAFFFFFCLLGTECGLCAVPSFYFSVWPAPADEVNNNAAEEETLGWARTGFEWIERPYK